jgi:hypothetical protein
MSDKNLLLGRNFEEEKANIITNGILNADINKQLVFKNESTS